MKKLLLLVLALCTFTLVSCGTKEPVDTRETLTVGMECAYAPFNWTESKKTDTNYPIEGSNNYADGYDVQIAKKVADALNMRLVIKPVEWDGLIPALEAGQIDLIIAGMSPTEDRKLSVDFTNAYYTSTHVLVMNKTSKYVTGTSLTDFAGANVVGQVETLYDSLIDQLVGANHQTALGDVPTIITAITSGRSDITILEEPVAKGVVEQNTSLTYIKLTNSFVVSEEDVVVSIAVKKGREELVNKINEVLSTIDAATRTKLMDEATARSNNE